jgi:hypothetical protein
MRILTHDKNRLNQRLWAFIVSWSPSFVLGLPPRGGFWIKSKWPWNMIELMPCRDPCRLYIHLAFTYSVGPSSIVWSELGPALPCPPMRVLEVKMVTGSQSRVWSGPKATHHIGSLKWPCVHGPLGFEHNKPLDCLHLAMAFASGKVYDLVWILSGSKPMSGENRYLV